MQVRRQPTRHGIASDLFGTGHIDVRGDQDPQPGHHGRDQVRQRHALGEIAEVLWRVVERKGGRGKLSSCAINIPQRHHILSYSLFPEDVL